MTNNHTTNGGAGSISLPDDIVDRVMALRNGKEPDGAYIVALLRAGIEAMERVAAPAKGPCGNPDCEACAGLDESRRLKAVSAEFDIMLEQLLKIAAESEAGIIKDRQVTFTISEASLMFMAWLQGLMEWRARGGMRVVGTRIDLDKPVHMERAVRYLEQMVPVFLDGEVTAFVHERHPLLYAPKRDEEQEELPF
jgi:hypothetical protein